MKILIISHYFYPENFKINDIALGLKSKGHELTILTGKPNYPKGRFYDRYSFFNMNFEEWKGIGIYRCFVIPRGNGSSFKLFLNYISFALSSLIRILFIRKKFDKIFVYQPSPITVGIPAVFSKFIFKAPVYFWVQDLWPQSLSAAGGINNSLLLNLVDQVTRGIYSFCDRIFVQSKAFIPYLLNQKVSLEKINYLPNTTETFYKPLKSKKFSNLISNDKNYLKLIFAGNLGKAQSLETMIHSTDILSKKKIKIKWYILGDGRYKSDLERAINKLNLQKYFIFLGSYPSIEMPHFFSLADALYVSLNSSDIFSLTIPNKVQSYMACGKPIIASLNGEGSRIINESKSGITSPAENIDELVNSIIKFKNLSSLQRKKMGQNARSYFLKEFERNSLIEKIINYLNEK